MSCLDVFDLFFDLTLRQLAALYFKFGLLLPDCVSAFVEVLHDSIVHSFLCSEFLSQLLDFLFKLALDLLMLAALAVLVAFEFALTVLDMQLCLDLCLVDTFPHLLNIELKRRALLRERFHFFFELISKLFDLLILLPFLLFELAELLLFVQLSADCVLKRLKF